MASSVMWNQTYGGVWGEVAYSMVEASDGGYALAGNFGDYSSPSAADFWLVKTNEYLVDVPEFPSWTLLLTMLILVMAVAVIYRRILTNPVNGEMD